MTYAIRHKPSGRFLPVMKYFKGGTHTELDDPRPPRLFNTRTAAQNCLRHWLKGVLEKHSLIDFQGENFYTEEILPKPHRKPEEMEIVKVRLEVIE